MPASVALADFESAGFQMLDVSVAHVLALETVPPLHGDPFDRIMVAQAISTPLRLLTHDRVVSTYSDTIILV